MLLVPIPWAERVWALPFLTVLAPSERYYAGRKRQHKKLTDWARQMVLQLRRWLPKRALVVVADSSFAVISLLWRVRQLAQPICMIVRFRLDAALYEPAPPRRPHQKGRPRLKGKRLPTLAQVAENKRTKWQRVVIPHWYGEGRRPIEIVSGTAVWWHSGQPVVPIRWRIFQRDPRPERQVQDPGAVVHRLDRQAGADREMVRFEVATGSHAARGPHPPGGRDPAPVVRPGHLAHHTGSVGLVLAGDFAGASACTTAHAANPPGGLVSQDAADL